MSADGEYGHVTQQMETQAALNVASAASGVTSDAEQEEPEDTQEPPMSEAVAGMETTQLERTDNDGSKDEIAADTIRFTYLTRFALAITSIGVLIYTVYALVYYYSDSNTNEYELVTDVASFDVPIFYAYIVFPYGMNHSYINDNETDNINCTVFYQSTSHTNTKYSLFLNLNGSTVDHITPWSYYGTSLPEYEMFGGGVYEFEIMISLPESEKYSVDKDKDSQMYNGFYFGMKCQTAYYHDEYELWYDVNHRDTLDELTDRLGERGMWDVLWAKSIELSFGYTYLFYYSVYEYNNKKNPSQTDPAIIDEDFVSLRTEAAKYCMIDYQPDSSGRLTTYVIDWKKGWLDMFGEVGGAFSLISGFMALFVTVVAYGVQIGPYSLYSGLTRYARPEGSELLRLNAYMATKKD